jgi:protein-S-isoprenylcysteine O-methyltransferase Ste14
MEFRLRMVIMVLVITLGFWSPWIEWWGVGSRVTLLIWLALEVARTGLVSFSVATPLVIVVAALTAWKGAVLRVRGTAYLGNRTVAHGEMQAGRVLADGPFRFVRNPLYLGSWCMFAAMAFLMPVSGALFAMVLLTFFLFRLILGEEAFLQGQLGEAYTEYLHTVPRLFPSLRDIPRNWARPNAIRPQWGRAMIAEINPIGVFFILAVLSWNYDHRLMVRAILVCFGLSIVVRALLSESREP